MIPIQDKVRAALAEHEAIEAKKEEQRSDMMKRAGEACDRLHAWLQTQLPEESNLDRRAVSAMQGKLNDQKEGENNEMLSGDL